MLEMTRRAGRLALLVLLAFIALADAYPMMTSGKRFNQRAWAPYPVIYQPRTTRPYAPFYETYLPETTADLYYPQDPYDKFRVYQMPPYYYPDQYYYDDEEEPEEEGDVSPYASQSETWYNSPNAEANAVFLQNLVLAQMYKDANYGSQRYPYTFPKDEDYDEDGEPYVFGEPIRELATPPPPTPKEDQEVLDLKSLVDISGKQRRKSADSSRRSLEENRWVNKRSDSFTSTPVPELTDQDKEGQVEVVMPRPATSVRSPSFHQRSYQPSAYDAIKKMLIQQNQGERQPQKRSYILNEDSLVEQLGKLKKSS